MSRKTICLNMIVKNEALVIRRCLSTVRHLIDSWAIVDTGSTDGTQDIIREELAGLPGTLFERPWKNFGYNRTEARELARGHGDYLLLMDADDQLETSPGFKMPPMDCQAYESAVLYGGLLFYRINVIDNHLPWRFVGALHEYLACDAPFSRGRIEGLRTRIIGGGARSQGEARDKFLRDAAVLEAELEAEPNNARNVFYLAQSYRDAGEQEKALAAYDRRAAMGGFDQEAFCAQLEAARCADRVNRPSAEIIDRYLRAFEYRPTRAEPLGELAAYCRTHGDRWHLAKLFASRACEIPLSPDALFVEHGWYEWRSLDELSIAAYWLGEYEACKGMCERLLDKPELPNDQRVRVLANLNFARTNLGLPTVTTPLGPAGRESPGSQLRATPVANDTAREQAAVVSPPREPYGACPLCSGKDEGPLDTHLPESAADARPAWASEWLSCRKCGHAHARGHLAPEDLTRLFEQRFAAVPSAAAADAERRRWAPVVQAALTALGGFATLMAEEPPWSWLDVHPCGPGLLGTARELGFRTAALVDRVDFMARHLPGVELLSDDWSESPPAPRYRAISLRNVLDFVPFPLKVLRGVREALEPGGVCLLAFPNMDALSFALRDERESPHATAPGRHHLFSATRLIDLLNALEMPVVHFDVGGEGLAEVILVARKLGGEHEG